MKKIKIVTGSDHGGYEYKENIKKHLENRGFEVIDAGTFSKDSCDYPVIAKDAAKKVVSGEADFGILICGTGIGMSIAANKIKGIRAALCSDTYSARMTRMHNNSNILCLGERVVGIELVYDIVDTWISTEFEGGRHQRRIDMIEED